MSDMDVINDLEQLIGQKIEKVAFDVSWTTSSSYSTDDHGNITAINLDNCLEEEVPPNIFDLKYLEVLSLGENKLEVLPLEIEHLYRLKALYISNNRLTALSPEIANMTGLESLYLSSNQLTSFPSEMAKMTGLESLYLGSNQLTSLPSEIAKMTGLKSLDLRSNQLTSLPSEIAKMAGLVSLDLRSNQLTTLPVVMTELELEWKLESDFSGIALGENPLEEPPLEIVEQGRQAVIDWFSEQEAGELPLNEVKVLLVGEGEAGKTSLLKRLIGEEFDDKEGQTKGINLRKQVLDCNGREVTAHFWDFGGQLIMQAQHQFFLTQRSLYILVLDGRRDEDPEHWLSLIHSLGSGSPVLIVLNKLDENPGHDVNRRFLEEKYPGMIKGYYRVSCKWKNPKRAKVEDLKEAMLDVIPEMEILSQVWPESWFKVKRLLEDMSEPYISQNKYHKICRDARVLKTGDDTLVTYLNDLGVIVHFGDLALAQTNVIEPRWVTGAVYKILNSEMLAEKKGMLQVKDLQEMLKRQKGDQYDYPPDKHRFIIDLMLKFELCYKVNKNSYLIPDLLDIQEPEFEFDATEALTFRLKYDFLPKSIMPRFIVNMHDDIIQENGVRINWRTGVALYDKDFRAKAVVKSYVKDKMISIQITGPMRREYLAVIITQIRRLNRDFKELKVDERMALPDNPELAVSYETLIRHEQMNMSQIIPDGSAKAYEVKMLLGVASGGRDEQTQMLKKIDSKLENMGKKDIINLELPIPGVGKIDISEAGRRIKKKLR